MTWKSRDHFTLCFLQWERLSSSSSLIQNPLFHGSETQRLIQCLSQVCQNYQFKYLCICLIACPFFNPLQETPHNFAMALIKEYTTSEEFLESKRLSCPLWPQGRKGGCRGFACELPANGKRSDEKKGGTPKFRL